MKPEMANKENDDPKDAEGKNRRTTPQRRAEHWAGIAQAIRDERTAAARKTAKRKRVGTGVTKDTLR